MVNVTAQSLAELMELDNSISPEEFLATLSRIREEKAPRYRLELPWSPQYTGAATVLIWNKSELKFEIQEDSVNSDEGYQETFTSHFLEEVVKPTVTSSDWTYINLLKVEVQL